MNAPGLRIADQGFTTRSQVQKKRKKHYLLAATTPMTPVTVKGKTAWRGRGHYM